jgi:hypothetical protein
VFFVFITELYRQFFIKAASRSADDFRPPVALGNVMKTIEIVFILACPAGERYPNFVFFKKTVLFLFMPLSIPDQLY